jgi:hypothetical protein
MGAPGRRVQSDWQGTRITKTFDTGEGTVNGNQMKYLSYKEAWGRINIGIEAGFYFEAVTICESIISDRLYSYVKGVDPDSSIRARTAFSELIKKWRQLATLLPSDPEHGDLGFAVDAWRKVRNEVVHGLVKSEPGTPTEDVGTFLERAEKAAKDGKALARKVDDWHKGELRRARM